MSLWFCNSPIPVSAFKTGEHSGEWMMPVVMSLHWLPLLFFGSLHVSYRIITARTIPESDSNFRKCQLKIIDKSQRKCQGVTIKINLVTEKLFHVSLNAKFQCRQTLFLFKRRFHRRVKWCGTAFMNGDLENGIGDPSSNSGLSFFGVYFRKKKMPFSLQIELGVKHHRIV